MNIWKLTHTTSTKIAHKLGYMCAIECIPEEYEYIFHFNDMCFIIESMLIERGYRIVEFYAHGHTYKFEFVYCENNIDSINLFEIHGDDICEWL